MGTIKHPKGRDSVAAQTEGGEHPRGIATKNYECAQPGQPGQAGKRFRDARGGVPDDQYNPGIKSSGGTFATGERGIEETDETTGVMPRQK